MRRTAATIGLGLALASARVQAAQPEPPAPEAAAATPYLVRMSDGVTIAVAVHLPSGGGKAPALLAASPYRIDNDGVPALPTFPFRETGPIGWYVQRGYAFVRMDVRGTGRSGGEFRVHDRREQRDLHEVIEWIARQPWSSGKVGGIGQSYYARSQWAMAVQAPPALACIAPYDGNMDNYHASAYTGGIPGNYPSYWYNFVRGINATPFAGLPRRLSWDFGAALIDHPTYDDFWRERSTAEALTGVKIPVFSIGVWGKVDHHLNGNIIGYQRVAGRRKLLLLGGAGVDAAVAEFSSPAFHERYLLPFYDWCLKGVATGWEKEPEVRYSVLGGSGLSAAASWPPRPSRLRRWFLAAGPSGSVSSINDGALAADPARGGARGTTLTYPHPNWSSSGSVRAGANGRPDTARNVLTFTTPPLARATLIAGPSMLRLHFRSSRSDADFIVKLYEQLPQDDADRRSGAQPAATLLSKGWLRASHRETDKTWSLPNAPWYRSDRPRPLTPNMIYQADIALMPVAARLRPGSRLRIEIANVDSAITDGIFAHAILADQVGSYTILHDQDARSELIVPEIDEALAR